MSHDDLYEDLKSIVSESRSGVTGNTATLEEDGFVKHPCVDSTLDNSLQHVEGVLRSMKRTDRATALTIVDTGYNDSGEVDLSVYSTAAVVQVSANLTATGATHLVGNGGGVRVAMPEVVRISLQSLPMWSRPSNPEAHWVAWVALNPTSVSLLPLSPSGTANHRLRTEWLFKTKWRENNVPRLQQMVANKRFAQLWAQATEGKLVCVELKRGDMLLTCPGSIIVPNDTSTFFLTFSLVPFASPTEACSVLKAIHEKPVSKPPMDTYQRLFKTEASELSPVFTPMPLPNGTTFELHYMLLVYAALQRLKSKGNSNGLFQRLRFLNETQHLISGIKGMHLNDRPELSKRRTDAVTQVNTMTKCNIWDNNIADKLEKVNDLVLQVVEEVAQVKPTLDSFLNKVRRDIAVMRPELTDPLVIEHAEWVEQAVVPDGRAPDYEEIRRRYDLVAKAFNPNYPGNGLPSIPPKSKKKQQPPHKEDPKKRRREKEKWLDWVRDPKVFAFILAKKPAPASAQEIECAACSASAIPFLGKFCQGCCTEALRSMAKEIFPAGLATSKKQPVGLINDINAFSAKAKEYRSAQDVGVYGKEVVFASFGDLMDKAAALIRRFQEECKIDLPKVVQRMAADALDRDWKEDEEEEDDYDDDDEGEDMLSGDDDDDEGEDEDECEDDADDDDDPNVADAKSIIGDGDDPMSASSEVVIPTKKSSRRSVNIATPDLIDDDDDDDEIVASEESAPGEPVRKKAKPKKEQQAIVVADPHPPATVVSVDEARLAAARIIRLKHALPGARNELETMENRYATTPEKGTPPAIWTAMLYELDQLEKAWSGPRYILELELMNAQGKVVRAFAERLEWNNENAATLGAHNYMEAHPGVKAKVVVKK